MKVSVKNFDEVKKLFLLDITNTVSINDIPPEMIINCDHTGINYVPVSSWIMEVAGSKRVEIIKKDDKRRLTAVFRCSMSGGFLPPQLIYVPRQDKDACHSFNFHPTGTLLSLKIIGLMRILLTSIL